MTRDSFHVTVADYKSSKFPLQEKHADVACTKCHIPAGKATVFKIKASDLCVTCHQDIHRNQFVGAPYFNRCEQCHNVTSFHAAGFDVARHQKTGFVLTGGHVAVACIDCHKPAANGRDVVYHFNELSCTTCHTDPHKGEFEVRMTKVAADGHPQSCESCHSTKTWSDLSRFDHGATKFALTGTHKATECAACHRPPNMERKLLNVNFTAASSKCEDCHEEAHGLQFAKAGSASKCVDCHTTGKWKPSLIDQTRPLFRSKGYTRMSAAGLVTSTQNKSKAKTCCFINRRQFSARRVMAMQWQRPRYRDAALNN